MNGHLAWSVLLIFAASIALCEEKKTWYKLRKGEAYVADFELVAGATTNASIRSVTNVVVYFRTNAKLAQAQKYKAPAGIWVEQLETGQWLSSVLGAGDSFAPKNMKVDLKITNKTRELFKILLVTIKQDKNSNKADASDSK